MMMPAYPKSYIDDAACTLGEYLDYMSNWHGTQIDKAFEMLAYSHVGREFEHGNPKYVAGMSGQELAIQVIFQLTGKWEKIVYNPAYDRTSQYWAGWAAAQYQWSRAVSFKKMIEMGLSASNIEKHYVLHEADITKFYDWADSVLDTGSKQKKEENINALRRLRKYANLTQKELSEKSGVSLRMVQLYEQGQNDLSKAQAWVVCSLADTLGTTVEELIATG